MFLTKFKWGKWDFCFIRSNITKHVLLLSWIIHRPHFEFIASFTRQSFSKSFHSLPGDTMSNICLVHHSRKSSISMSWKCCLLSVIVWFASLTSLPTLYVGCQSGRMRIFQSSVEERVNIQSSQWCPLLSPFSQDDSHPQLGPTPLSFPSSANLSLALTNRTRTSKCAYLRAHTHYP